VDAFYSAKTLQVRLASILAIGIGLACVTSCARFNPRGEGFRETFSEAAQYQRQSEPSAPAFGYSEKARQIERDFGVSK
jgi:hypothetical protein